MSEHKPDFDLEFVGTPEFKLPLQAPFKEPMTVTFEMVNPHESQAVCFKNKCTNNQRFKIRPVVGFIKPKENMKVTITVSPFEFDRTKCRKERFIIAHSKTPEGDPAAAGGKPRDFWTNKKPEYDAKRREIYVQWKDENGEIVDLDKKPGDPATPSTPATPATPVETPKEGEAPKEPGDPASAPKDPPAAPPAPEGDPAAAPPAAPAGEPAKVEG